MAGGGPLMDVGIYCLNACRYLTGEEPAAVSAVASVVNKDGRFKEVEENVAWTLKFPSGALASCSTTYGAVMPGFFRVHGSKGILSMEPAFDYDGLRLDARVQGEPPIEERSAEKDPYQFVLEADHMAECILENKEPKSNGEEGLRDTQWMARIYSAAGLKLGA